MRVHFVPNFFSKKENNDHKLQAFAGADSEYRRFALTNLEKFTVSEKSGKRCEKSGKYYG